MKRIALATALFTLLLVGAIAYAYGPGRAGGYTAGSGCSGGLTGPGYGWNMMGGMMGGMMGWTGQNGLDRKFLDETAELRKELHNKRFDYFEALRDPDTTPETIAGLEKEIRDLRERILEKAPRRGYGMYGGYGCSS